VEFIVYRRLLYFLDLGSGSGSETIDIDRLIRMNWDLGYFLQHLEVLAFSDSGFGSLSKINFHACSQPPCNTLCYAVSSCSLFRIVDSKQPYPSASICPLLFEGRERKTHKKGKPIINPIQKNRFPTVLFRLIIGIRPTAIMGN
jgi:hypothetical protein